MRLNFSYLTNIHILNWSYNPRIIRHIFKNKQKKQRCIYSWIDYKIDHNDDGNEK